MEYHDVHTTYLDGLLSTLNNDCTGSLHSTVPDVFKYPGDKKYSVGQSHLLPQIKKLRMTMNTDWKRVRKFLDECQRELIETEPGVNNALEAIHLQLHVPKEFKIHMLRHLVAEHFALYPEFFVPKMQKYLKESKLGYNKYIYSVYHGEIWCDEYILGAIGRMFNIRISVISPLFSGLWHVYHDGKEDADVILIANGRGFRTEFDKITHFTATKGNKDEWKCVGSHLELLPVEKYSGFVEGQSMALDFDTIQQSKSIVSKSQDVLNNVNKLCQDIHRICIDRDQIIKDLKGLDIEVGNFRKLTSFYIRDEKPEFSKRQKLPATKRKLEIFPSDPGAIPKVRVKDIRQTETGQKILAESAKKRSEQLTEAVTISHMKEKTLTSDGEKVRDSAKRKSTQCTKRIHDGTKQKAIEASVQKKLATNIHQISGHEQDTRDDIPPPRKRCKIKSGGRTVCAPMLVPDPKLPSLGEYSQMIRTPEKNPVQDKRQYHLAKNKESEITAHTSDKEEGEVDDTTSDLQLDSDNNINDYENEDENNENESKESGSQSELDQSEEASDTGIDVCDDIKDENIFPDSKHM